MIQRIQTLWLLVAGACGLLTLKLPFYYGSKGALPAEPFTAMSNTLLLILTVAVATLALVTVFFYTNRRIQLRLGAAGLLLSIINIIQYFVHSGQYDTGGIALSSIFVFAVPVFFLLALRGIYKDEKLIKSVDRLR